MIYKDINNTCEIVCHVSCCQWKSKQSYAVVCSASFMTCKILPVLCQSNLSYCMLRNKMRTINFLFCHVIKEYNLLITVAYLIHLTQVYAMHTMHALGVAAFKRDTYYVLHTDVIKTLNGYWFWKGFKSACSVTRVGPWLWLQTFATYRL